MAVDRGLILTKVRGSYAKRSAEPVSSISSRRI